MKLPFNLFLIKRPKKSVLEKSKEYEETGNLSTLTDIWMDKRRCIKYGFEDGYVKCLEDLGIMHTINGHVNLKSKKYIIKC